MHNQKAYYSPLGNTVKTVLVSGSAPVLMHWTGETDTHHPTPEAWDLVGDFYGATPEKLDGCFIFRCVMGFEWLDRHLIPLDVVKFVPEIAAGLASLEVDSLRAEKALREAQKLIIKGGAEPNKAISGLINAYKGSAARNRSRFDYCLRQARRDAAQAKKGASNV